ncbi:ferritin-like domain-containing protein [Methylobacterium durans]|uniref:ferritin-like domain-containing protein n=1 Tax=Methylobacterium durans TaxID=2202825 RepID=UPI002AFDE1CD|nr:ferritin-like domain-containing protein [Methylobacterium durans]MEA1834455.1 ferritin-like domain-containing protein [Methylobacterium durans]
MASASFLELNLGKAFAQRGAALAGGAVDLGRGDFAVLNYAYALEQLEAAFYTQVLQQPYRGFNARDEQILSGIQQHEVAHREFFRSALGGNAIPDLQVDFQRVNFSSRQSVLTTARTFEDLGVAAYNGAGQLLSNPDFLAKAGSIVSVEARHAATIRDLLNPFSPAFAGNDVVDASGLDGALVPSQVLPKVAPFVVTPVSASQLP